MTSDLIVRLLFEATVRVALFLSLAAVVCWAARRASADLRHALWGAGLAAALLIPLGLFVLPRWQLPVLPARPNASVVSSVSVSEPSERHAINGWIEPIRTSRAPFPISTAIALLWLAGLGAFAAREIRCRHRLRALLRASRPVADPRVVRAFREASDRIGIDFTVECRLSPTLRIPIACGIERPMVLLPESAAAWSPEVLADVLVHELAHLRRRDPLWLTIARSARALYWFHPLVWLATRQMLAESERACDDAVMRTGERPSRYAETLLFVASAPRRDEPRAVLAFVRGRSLERRIADVLAQGRNLRALSASSRKLVSSLAILSGLAVAIAQPVVVGAHGRTATPTAAPTAAPAAPATTPAAAAPVATPEAEHVKPWRAGGAPRKVEVSVCNENDPRVRLLGATVEITPGAAEDARVANPQIELENPDGERAVVAVQLAFDLPTTRDRIWKDVDIASDGSAKVRVAAREWSAVVPAKDAKRLVIQVTGVRFATGDAWEGEETVEFLPSKEIGTKRGKMETPAPKAARADGGAIEVSTTFPDGSVIPVRFRNPDDAPLIIVAARTPKRDARPEDDRPMTYLPAVMLENRGDRTVTAVRLRYKADAESHAVSGYLVTIDTHSTIVLGRRDFEFWGSASDMTVQVLGVRFADGSVWGTLDSRINGRDRWVYPLKADPSR